MKVMIEDWIVDVEGANEDEARTKIKSALRKAGIKVQSNDLSLSVFCNRCKYMHSGDCATI